MTAASTRARLKASREAGTLSTEDAGTLRDAFELFSSLRMEHQVDQLRDGERADDLIAPSSLTPVTRTALKEAFRAVSPRSTRGRGEARAEDLTRCAGRSWRDARFIAIDIETTGLDPERDELISFAGIPIEHGRIIVSQEVHGLVLPRAATTGASTEIHGLRDYDLAGAPSAPDALAPLAALMHGRIPVVHAQWVERTFLGKAGCPLPRTDRGHGAAVANAHDRAAARPTRARAACR